MYIGALQMTMMMMMMMMMRLAGWPAQFDSQRL